MTSFTHLRKDFAPPIEAIGAPYRLHRTPPPTVLPLSATPRNQAYLPVSRQSQKPSISSRALSTCTFHSEQLSPRISLRLATGRFHPSSIVEHNKQLMYNLHSPQSPRVKDVQWVRALRKAPWSMRGEQWKRNDETLRSRIVNAGRVKMFLQDGTEVEDGKALVSVGYPYCHSCKRGPIEVHLR